MLQSDLSRIGPVIVFVDDTLLLWLSHAGLESQRAVAHDIVQTAKIRKRAISSSQESHVAFGTRPWRCKHETEFIKVFSDGYQVSV